LHDYTVPDCYAASLRHRRAFLSQEEPTDAETVDFDIPEVHGRSTLKRANAEVDKTQPWVTTVTRVVNRELKSSGFTYLNGTRSYHIAQLIRYDAVAETLTSLPVNVTDHEVERTARRVARKHIARYGKRSTQNLEPSSSGPTNGDDNGDGCSLGNGFDGGSSLEEAEDFSLSVRHPRRLVKPESERMFGRPTLWTLLNGALFRVPFDEALLSEKSRRNYNQTYRRTNHHKVRSCGRADYQKVQRLEDVHIAKIDQSRRVHTLVKAAVNAVGLADWRWMVDAYTRRRRGERLNPTERSRLCRLRRKLEQVIEK
jgi:hypothetical protein